MPKETQTVAFARKLAKILHEDLSISDIDTTKRMITISCNGMSKFEDEGKGKEITIRYCSENCIITALHGGEHRIQCRPVGVEETAKRALETISKIVEKDVKTRQTLGIIEYAVSEAQKDFEVKFSDPDHWTTPRALLRYTDGVVNVEYTISVDNVYNKSSGDVLVTGHRLKKSYDLADPDLAFKIKHDLKRNNKLPTAEQ